MLVKGKMVSFFKRSAHMPLNPLLRRVARKIRSLLTRPPEDPHEYAMVGVPVRPKPPRFSAKAAVDPKRHDSR